VYVKFVQDKLAPCDAQAKSQGDTTTGAGQLLVRIKKVRVTNELIGNRFDRVCVVFGSALLGLFLRTVLPDHHLSEEMLIRREVAIG
jgi:hypothetical protein